MLHLELTELLAHGGERDCWVHPTDPGLVVKTTRRVKTDRNQNDQDYLYYQWLLRTNKVNDHIPHVLGWCSTQYGPGLVCTRAINADGTPARDLAEGLAMGVIDEDIARQLVEEAFQVFLRHGITICDDTPENFLCVHDAEAMRLVVVDGPQPCSLGEVPRLRQAGHPRCRFGCR